MYKRKRPTDYFSTAGKKFRAPAPAKIVQSRRRRYSRVSGRSAGALVSTETKYFSTGLGNHIIAIDPTWAGSEIDPGGRGTLFYPIQGSGIDEREGRKVYIKRIRVHGLIAFQRVTAANLVPNMPSFRVILYLDKQTNGAQAQAEDVMTGNTVPDPGQTLCSFQNVNSFGRFQVLKDRVYKHSGMGIFGDDAGPNTGSAEFGNVPFKFDVKWRTPLITHFNQTNGGTVADIVDNSLHLICFATNNTNDVWRVTYNSRVYFCDG